MPGSASPFLFGSRCRHPVLDLPVLQDPQADAEEESQEVVDQFFKDAARQFDNERLRKQFEGRKKNVLEVGLNNW